MANENPTRTRSIEAAWNKDINRRWREFRRNTTERLKNMNGVAVLANAAIPFELDPRLIAQYMNYYQSQIDKILLGTPEPPNWQAQYQLESYLRGLQRTSAALRAQGVDQALHIDVSTMPIAIIETQLPPAHNAGLEFLYTRSYESLRGWTDSLARETRQILVDGFNQGQGINEVTKNIVDRQNVSKSRARVIARTETIQAYQRSSTTEAQRLSEETGEEIGMRWITSEDTRVRHLHATFHGTVVSPEENFNRINRSPWNCRCSQVPVVPGTQSPAKEKRFKEERQRMLLLERK